MNSDQSPEDAAAPRLPELVQSESVTSSSLVDVDAPSVRTVPSDFLEQDIQTDTQARRIELEEEEEEEEQAQAQAAAAAANVTRRGGSKKHKKGKRAEEAAAAASGINAYLTRCFASLGDGAASAVVVGNLVAVVGVSAWLSYRAWGAYEAGRLGWRSVVLGFGAVGMVSAVEVVLGGYLYKTRGRGERP